jgi:hypothetical protein
MVNASVTNVPSEKKFRFIKRLTVSNADVDVKRRANKSKVTLTGRPIGRPKPNSTEKPFWSFTATGTNLRRAVGWRIGAVCILAVVPMRLIFCLRLGEASHEMSAPKRL